MSKKHATARNYLPLPSRRSLICEGARKIQANYNNHERTEYPQQGKAFEENNIHSKEMEYLTAEYQNWIIRNLYSN